MRAANRRLLRFPSLSLALAVVATGACECGEVLNTVPAPKAVLAYGADETPPKERLDIALGASLVNTPRDVELTLRNDGNALLDVLDVRLVSDPVLCPTASGAYTLVDPPVDAAAGARTFQVEAAKSQGIVVRFLPTSGAPGCAVVEVTTSDEANERLIALLTGQGDAPQLCADRAVIDFGEVFVGDRAEDTVHLESCGTRAIVVEAFTVNDQLPPFEAQLPTAPLTLAPGEGFDVPVAFAPVDEGSHTLSAGTAGLITLDTDAEGQQYQIALIGSSRRPPSCELAVVPGVVNFGTVAAGRTSTQTVVLRNQGELDCQLDDISIRAPAGSFSVDVGAFMAGQTLAPLGTLTVDVTFAPQGAAGAENGFLDVLSSDPVNPTSSVSLEGNSVEPTPCLLEAAPTGLNFGNQALRRTADREIVLTNVGTETCTVKRVELSSGAPHFDVIASVFPFIGTPVPVGSSLTVRVTYRPEAEGAHTGNARITYKELGFGNPDVTLDVPLTGQGLSPRLCITPAELDFGTVNAGQSADEQVAISNCGPTDAVLRGLELRAASHPGFSLPTPPALPDTLAPGEQVMVTVRAAPQSGGPMYGFLDVLSDDSANPAFPVALRANAAQCSQGLVCSPDPLDFGEVDVGSDLVRAVTCQNPGTSAVAVSASVGAPFSVVNAPASVPPAGSGVITVRYTPDGAGADTGVLDLGANDCQGSPLQIDLLGDGVDNALPVCPTPDAFTPEVVWHWDGGTTLPQSKQVWVTPLVARLEDTTGDSLVTRDDMPRVVFISFDHTESPDPNPASQEAMDHINDPTPGVLRAVTGDTGAEVFTVANEEYRLNSSVTPALIDIDADGFVEIIAQKWIVLEGVEDIPDGPKVKGKFVRGSLLAFEHDGTFKWESEEWSRSQDEIEDAAGLAVGDVDGDGFAEIAVGDHLFDHHGRLLFRGGAGTGSTGHGPASVLADVDGQPGLELVAGSTVYRNDGSVLWDRSDLGDGHPAVGDLDGDGDNEVVLMNGRLYVLDGATGQTVAGPKHPPTRMDMGAECLNTGGAEGEDPCSVIPTNVALADVDGSGTLEIAVARQEILLVYDRNLDEVWRTQIWDGTGASGPLAFDFEADGAVDIVYSDEGNVWVYDQNGTATYQAERGSVTMMETTAIADIDLDGHANMVIGSNEPVFGLSDGLDMLTNSGTSWVHARAIWNQHAYVESLVGELGTPVFDSTPDGLPGFRTASAQCRQ